MKKVYLHYTTVYFACSLLFVSLNSQPDGYLVQKELVILRFVCVVGNMNVRVLCIFFSTWCICCVTLNLIASIPGPFIIAFYIIYTTIGWFYTASY